MQIVEVTYRTGMTNELVHPADCVENPHRAECYVRNVDTADVSIFYGVETVGGQDYIVTEAVATRGGVIEPSAAEKARRIGSDAIVEALRLANARRAVVPAKATDMLAKIDADIAALQALLA